MKYYLFKVGEKEYKLRLSAAAVVDVEKRLGRSIMDVMMKCGNGSLPGIEELIVIFHGSLQKFHEELSIEDTYGIFDEFADNGGDITEFIMVITEVLAVSGFFSRERKGETEKAKKEKQGA